MAREDENRQPRWRTAGHRTDRDESSNWPGDRSRARNYNQEDMRRYNRRSIEQGEELRRMRGQQSERENAGFDQNFPRASDPRAPYRRRIHARPPYRETRAPDVDRDQLRIELSRGYPAGREPWNNMVDNYWGQHQMQRNLRRDYRPGDRRDPRNSIGGRHDVTSGRYNARDIPTRPQQDWSEDREYDMDPGFAYEFGTDFDFFDRLEEEDAHHRSQSQRSGRQEPWNVPGPFTGMGPENYHPSDERINENICEFLSHSRVDSSGLRVEVEKGVVTLSGDVDRREEKYLAEDIAAAVSGVTDVDNRIHVRQGKR